MDNRDLLWFRETFVRVDFPIVMFGKCGVGKTSLTTSFFSNMFKKNNCKTIIARNVLGTKQMTEDNVTFNVWDTAGSNAVADFSFLDLKKMKAAIIVYDVTKYGSFVMAKKYFNALRKTLRNEMIALVANKIDLVGEGKGCVDEGKKFAKDKGLQFFETSAKYGTNVQDVFHKLYYGMSQKRNKWIDVLHAIC